MAKPVSFSAASQKAIKQQTPPPPSKESALHELASIAADMNNLIASVAVNTKNTQGKPLHTLDFSVLFSFADFPAQMLKITSAALQRMPYLEACKDPEVQTKVKALKPSLKTNSATAQADKEKYAFLLPYLEKFGPLFAQTTPFLQAYQQLAKQVFVVGQGWLQPTLKKTTSEQYGLKLKALINQVKMFTTNLAKFRTDCHEDLRPIVDNEWALFRKDEENYINFYNLLPFLEQYLPHFERISNLKQEISQTIDKLLDPTSDDIPTQEQLLAVKEVFQERFLVLLEQTLALLNQEKNSPRPAVVKQQIDLEIENLGQMREELEMEMEAIDHLLSGLSTPEKQAPVEVSGKDRMSDSILSVKRERTETEEESAEPGAAPAKRARTALKQSSREEEEMKDFVFENVYLPLTIGIQHPDQRDERLQKIREKLHARFASHPSPNSTQLFLDVLAEYINGKINYDSKLIKLLAKQNPLVPAFLPTVKQTYQELDRYIAALSIMIKSIVPESIPEQWIPQWQKLLKSTKDTINTFEASLKANKK
jgi:hypothetical protein